MDSEEEKILMTTTRPAAGHTILKIERLTAAQLDENGAMHVGGGDNKGIIINRPGVTVKSDLDGKAAHLRLSFPVNSSTNNAHVEEKRSLKFWFKEGITENDQLMTAHNESEEEETDDSCYDEIDQIYDYVRGFAPLPEKLRPVRATNPNSPPEPPPIETIPSLVSHQHHHGASHHPSYPSHHHSRYRRLSYPTVFHEILRKMGLYVKKVSPSEHIYDKVLLSSGHHRPEKRYHSGNIRSREMSYHHQQSSSSHNHGPRIPMKFNSTGKVYLPFNGLPVHPHPVHLSSVDRWTCRSSRSSRSSTTSPIFNIRYKSLTNLYL